MECGRKKWIWAAFAVYCAALAWLLLAQRMGDTWPEDYWDAIQGNMNLVPLRTVRHFIRLVLLSDKPALIRFAAVNLAGNVAVFVPLGAFLPVLWPGLGKLWRTALCLAAVVAAVEVIQLVTFLGVCDVDDLLLNMAGGLIGYGLYAAFRRRAGPGEGDGHDQTEAS